MAVKGVRNEEMSVTVLVVSRPGRPPRALIQRWVAYNFATPRHAFSALSPIHLGHFLSPLFQSSRAAHIVRSLIVQSEMEQS